MAAGGGEKLGEIYVAIKAKTDELDAELKRLKTKVEKDGEAQGKAFAGGFNKGFAVLGTLGVFAAFTKVISTAIGNAKKQVIAEAQVTQAVERTGKAAGFTAKELFKMASQLQKISGIGDEAILENVTNRLLTFGRITGDVFKRTQQAVVDMNAVLSKGEAGALTTQAMQLGRALDSPIQGLTALTRIGVTFTEQQKDQIKLLTEQNKLQEAQGIILSAVESKFGGQAKALADADGGMRKMLATYGDFLERIGKPFFTVLSRMTVSFEKLITPAADLSDQFIEQKERVQKLETSLGPLLKRYDELKGKANLNTGEQTELKKVVNDIALLLPNAVTEWNKYGEAIDIARGKVEEMVAAEKVRLQFINKDAIKEMEDQRVAVEKEIAGIVKTLNDGYLTITRSQGVMGASVRETIKQTLSTEQIEAFRDQVVNLNKDLQGIDEQIKFLKGESATQPTTKPIITVTPVKVSDEEKARQTLKEINKLLADKNISSERENELLKQKAFLIDKYLKAEISSAGKTKIFDFDTSSLEKMQQDFDNNMSLIKLSREELTLFMKEQDQVTLDNSKLTTEAIYQDWLEKNRELEGIANNLSAAFTSGLFDGIRIKAEETNNALIKGFHNMANAFIAEIERMIAKWLAAEFLEAVFGGETKSKKSSGSSWIELGIKLLTSLFGGEGAHDGGNFIGTPRGVKKMAAGGSFIVPPGFPNDSYPLMVESGERVSVTPTRQVGNEYRILAEINSSIRALNMNLLRKDLSVHIQNNAPDVEVLVKRLKKVENRLAVSGMNFNER